MFKRTQGQRLRRSALLAMSIVSLCCTIALAQVRKIDGATVAVDTSEFKDIIENNVALNACDSLLVLERLKVRDLGGLVKVMEMKADMYAKREQQLIEMVDSQKPGWFNNFLTGFGVSSAVFVALIVLTR